MDDLELREWFSGNDYHYKIAVDTEGEYLREGIKLLTMLSSGSIGLMLTLIQTIAPSFVAEPLAYCALLSFVVSLVATLIYNFSAKECCVHDQDALRNSRHAMMSGLQHGWESAASSTSPDSGTQHQAHRAKRLMIISGTIALYACILGIVLFSVFGGMNIHQKAVASAAAKRQLTSTTSSARPSERKLAAVSRPGRVTEPAQTEGERR